MMNREVIATLRIYEHTKYLSLVFSSIWNMNFYLVFLYQCIRERFWPFHYKVKGQPSIIIWTKNSVGLGMPMLHTKTQGHLWFGSGEDDFWRVFYHTIIGIALDFHHCQESPYKIWLWMAEQFQRRWRLTVTDGQTTEAACPISSLNGFWEIQPYMNWRGWGMPLWIHSWQPQGHNLNNLSKGLLDKTTKQTSKGWAKKIFTVFPYMGYAKWLTPWAGPLLTPGLLFLLSC